MKQHFQDENFTQSLPSTFRQATLKNHLVGWSSFLKIEFGSVSKSTLSNFVSYHHPSPQHCSQLHPIAKYHDTAHCLLIHYLCLVSLFLPTH